MSIQEQTVRDLAASLPGATRVFEEFGIDYCCGGGKSLRDACAKVGIPEESVTEALERASQSSKTDEFDWNSSSLGALADYIVERHHSFTKTEISRLEQLSEKVASVHGKKHPELLEIQSFVQRLGQDLQDHMLKEEQVLFPRIKNLEQVLQSSNGTEDALDLVRMPIMVMTQEHDSAGEILHEMRRISSDYLVPGDACMSYRTLYEALQEFERDLHQHIHLENNILFPRTIHLGS